MLTASPNGLTPLMHPSGQVRPSVYPGGIESGYGTALYFGAPVTLATTGFLVASTTNQDWLGCFCGVSFVDATQRAQVSSWWVAGTVATQIEAFVIDDPLVQYAIQATGSLTAASVGDQADFVNPGAGNTLGFSTAAFGALVGAGVQGQMRVLRLYTDPDNNWGDAFTTVVVQNARQQYVANKVAV